MLTDSTGTVTDTYEYDPFGNLIAKTGNTENPFLFTGQQYDPNVCFYYLRARYYQPNTGRFTAIDPYAGDIYTPLSLHRYLYAADDPVNKIDPSGRMSLIEQAVVLAMVFEIPFMTLTIVNGGNGNLNKKPFKDQDGICSEPVEFLNKCAGAKFCCKLHDDCYTAYKCNESSWFNLFPSLCQSCNVMVAVCMATSFFDIGEE
jgi:RHS repeat-associated protein